MSRDILKLQMKHVMTFHMVCIWICVLIQPIYLLQWLVPVINSIYQQSLQKTEHFDVEMYRNGKVTELKFYNVSTFVSIQERCLGSKTVFS